MKLFSTTIIFLFICLLLSSCAETKSKGQMEAEQIAQQWFENAFAKCEDSYVTNYSGRQEVKFGLKGDSISSGLIQFKTLTFIVKEIPLTEPDKLNKIEWKGQLELLPLEPTLRFTKSYDNKWSEWLQTTIIYHSPFFPEFDGESSPFLQKFKQTNGKWEGLSKDFAKPNCADVPK